MARRRAATIGGLEESQLDLLPAPSTDGRGRTHARQQARVLACMRPAISQPSRSHLAAISRLLLSYGTERSTLTIICETYYGPTV